MCPNQEKLKDVIKDKIKGNFIVLLFIQTQISTYFMKKETGFCSYAACAVNDKVKWHTKKRQKKLGNRNAKFYVNNYVFCSSITLWNKCSIFAEIDNKTVIFILV